MWWTWCEWMKLDNIFQNHAWDSYERVGKTFCFNEGQDSAIFFPILWLTSVVYLLDAIIHLRTAYVRNHGHLEFDGRRIMRYQMEGFIIDTLSFIGALSIAARFKPLSIFALFKLRRVFEFQRAVPIFGIRFQ